MADTSPLSYQTTMPEYPDVSYERWRNLYGGPAATRLGSAIYAWTQNSPNYETWRINQFDKYNADLNAYNTWLGTGEGQRASLESGDYNPSYFGGQSSSASPLSYQDVNPGSGFNEMAQGVSGAFTLAQALAGYKMKVLDFALNAAFKKAQVQNLQERTKGMATDNLWKNPFWTARVLGLNTQSGLNKLRQRAQEISNQWSPNIFGRQYDLLGYQADKLELENSQELYSRFGPGAYVSGSGSAYNLNNVNLGLGYQRAYQDIQLAKQSRELQKQQAQVAKFNAKEKEFYVSSIQKVYKEFLETQLGLAKGNLKFQRIQQDIYQKAFKWKVGLGVANTTINGIKTAIGLFNPVGRLLNGTGGVSPSIDFSPDIYGDLSGGF